jgi:hypothetical protein
MEQWQITSGHELTVQTFLENLGTKDRKQDQYGCCVSNAVTTDVNTLHSQLMKYHTPTTINLLKLEMGSDYYFEQFPELDEMVIEVRSLFVFYVQGMKEKRFKFAKTVEFFTMLYRYHVMFTNYKTHGMHKMFKELTCLLLNTLYEHRALPLFLIFCEFYPDMVTANYFPVCKPLSADSVQDQMAFIQSSLDLLSLYIKHRAKWEPFLQTVV